VEVARSDLPGACATRSQELMLMVDTSFECNKYPSELDYIA